MTIALRSPFGAKLLRAARPTLAAMNDPWLPMIAALSGQRIATPSTWPAREVHRLDGPGSAGRFTPQPERRQSQAPTAKTFALA